MKDNGGSRRFAAFISYAHSDAAIAAKLQSKLERYRLPKHIAAAHAEGRAALGQIFRDREDLAAAPSLSDAIRAAIAEAEALVVICSPDARASRWVGEEIALFRALHPGKPILAALVRGEPADAFPDALTEGGTEPLAADLRPKGDGEALGFLKIVAGIAGVPLDTLVQRDAQRRIRRVMWITGGALAAMLVMGIMTTLALQARNETARQRAEAEGLVEYMLTDLRDRLKGVGRLDVMEGVNERAMEHYVRQGDLEDLPADSLERRARVLHAMGEDDDKNGKLDRALPKFIEAHRTTAALLARAPQNPDRIFAHAQSEYWVGFAARRHHDSGTTEKYWQGYLKQAEALARVEPNAIRSMMELGYAHGNLCELFVGKKIAVAKGTGHCKNAITFQKRAVELDPDNASNIMALANRLGFMADALVAHGQYEAAAKHRTQEQQLVDRLLADDKKNVELRQRQTWPQIGLGWIEYSRGDLNAAKIPLRSAITRLEQLSLEFPDDQTILVANVRARVILAMVLRKQNDLSWRIQRSVASAILQQVKKAKLSAAVGRIEDILLKFDREIKE